MLDDLPPPCDGIGSQQERTLSQELHGNTEGLKASQVKQLKALYRRRTARSFLAPELARAVTEAAADARRQVALVIDRAGEVRMVVVGDAHGVFLPDLGRARAGSGRLRGLRLVVTPLRGEGLTRDNLTDLVLLRLDAVVAVAVEGEGLPGAVTWAHLLPRDPLDQRPVVVEEGRGEGLWQVETRASVHHWDDDFDHFIADLEGQLARTTAARAAEDAGRTRAILVGWTLTRDRDEAERSLEELERLASTAGLRSVDRLLQVRRAADPRYVIGEGKLKDLLLRSMAMEAEVLVFDNELAPSQLRNVASATDLKVLDRTQLILDIFALRATTLEGKLQVELAQLRYRRPRLAVMPTAMSRLTGGIGGRGPGETQLEINRRRADEREKRLEVELGRLARSRDLHRERRRRVGLPQVAIVGYTNAGKSSLLNRMTRSTVDAEDKLFATLDPTSRRLRFPRDREIVLTDTVGFIRRLPKELVQAFRSTLEEVVDADLLIHVIDATSEEATVHVAAVRKVLEELGAGEKPTVRVLNKVDAVDPALKDGLRRVYDAVLVSARTGEGLDRLLALLEQRLFQARASAEAAEEVV